ncbi:MAG: response regulator [Verrucomicrobiota bacterium]
MPEAGTILVVDDNAVNRAVLFDYLDNRGYRVLVAETGEASVEITSMVEPDIVLMDVMLPGIDGYEACRRIRKLKNRQSIPILYMSALDDNQSKAEGLKAGGNAFLTKPILYDEVESLLATYLKLQELEKNQGSDERHVHPLSEFNAIVDIIAHDMKSPLVCILGFADELAEQFSEKTVPEEWVECASIIKKSSSDIDIILEALVLLKNLRLKKWKDNTSTSLEELVQNVTERYQSLETVLPLQLEKDISDLDVMSEPVLLEELILILWRNFSNLNFDYGKDLSLSVKSSQNESGMIVLSMEAVTREILEQELPHILEPMSGGKRKKVKDTNILTVCAQKLIEFLAINAWAERTNKGLRINLSFSPPK